MASAPTASAIGSSACTRNDKNHFEYNPWVDGVPVHTGPGSTYKVKGRAMADIYVACSRPGGKHRWWYSRDNESGLTGWIYGSYFHY
ncbi:hypothetical protein [Streptomyces decoyicus]|nr:hypothetical protein OG532_19070 [Streptomyces decoyicus]